MASNQGRDGNQGRQGSRGRGFAAMDANEQRRIARKGGQASARSQSRDSQGQFAGSRDSGSRGSGGSGGSRASGGSRTSSGSRGRGGGGRSSGGGGSNR